MKVRNMAAVHLKKGQMGFSLIELMVALAITGILLTGIYSAYQDQLRTSLTQGQIVDMNQNLRAAMLLLEQDLRMGGGDPTGMAQAGFTVADATTFTLSMDDGGTNSQATGDGVDNDNDGMTDESDTDGIDNDGDGVIDEPEEEAEWYDGDTDDQGEIVMYDLNAGNLRRWFNSSGSTNPSNAVWLASNIDAIDFVYLDGSTPPAVIPTPVASDRMDDIRAVQVTIVARAGANVAVMARKHTDQTVYKNPQGTVLLDRSAAPDQFRRKMITTTIKCRNLGL